MFLFGGYCKQALPAPSAAPIAGKSKSGPSSSSSSSASGSAETGTVLADLWVLSTASCTWDKVGDRELSSLQQQEGL